MSDELVEDEIQAEPVLDEFILARQAEAAEYEDSRVRAVNDLKQLRAEAEDRDRVQADARFAEARQQHPHLSVHQIAAMLDGEPEQQYVNAIQI
jgi:hypothetical protein